MNEATVFILKLLEHYDAVETLHHAIRVIGALLVVVFIQTSRAAYHRARHEGSLKVNKSLKRQIDSHCEEITWHRDNGARLEARLFKETPPTGDAEES